MEGNRVMVHTTIELKSCIQIYVIELSLLLNNVQNGKLILHLDFIYEQHVQHLNWNLTQS